MPDPAEPPAPVPPLQDAATYQAIVETMPEGVVVVSPDGRIGFANRRAEELFGYPRGELLDRPVGTLVPDSAGWASTRHPVGCPACPMCVRHGVTARRKDGTEFPVDVRLGPAGGGAGVVAIIRGTTARDQLEAAVRERTAALQAAVVRLEAEAVERRQAEDAFRRSEHRFRLMAETIDEVFWVGALGGASDVYVSPAYETLMGQPRESLYAAPRSFLAAVHPDDRARVAAAVARVAEIAFAVEYRVVLPDGTLRWAEAHGYPVRDADGRVAWVAGTARDVTARKQAEDALRASEQRSRAQFQNSPLPTVCWQFTGTDFTLLDCNRAADRLTAGAIRGALGRPLSELHADRPEHREHIARCYRERVDLQADTHWDRVNWGPGGDLRIWYGFVPPDLVMTHVQVVTEQKRQDRALRESEERHRLVLSALQEGVLFLDAAGRVRTCNEAGAQILAGTVDDFLGREWSELIGAASREDGQPFPADQLPTAVARRTGRPCTGVTLVLDRPGAAPGRLRVNAFPLVRPDQPPPHPVVLSLADVSAQWQAEEQLRLHLAELAHVARYSTVGEMASVLAHELNQPLTAVVNFCRGCVRRLRDGSPDPGELAGALDLATAEALRAAAIIGRIRDFVRKREPHRSSVAINDVVRDALALVRPEAREYQTEVVIRPGHDLPLVQADRIQIEQVLLNLIRNALEAMAAVPVADRRLLVETTPGPDGGVRVQVTDRGGGFSPEVVPQLFQPFFTTKPNGMGLGLAISRTIVEAHAGQLGAAPAPTGGARFWFTLPAGGTRPGAAH